MRSARPQRDLPAVRAVAKVPTLWPFWPAPPAAGARFAEAQAQDKRQRLEPCARESVGP